jgi:hypothetical protein
LGPGFALVVSDSDHLHYAGKYHETFKDLGLEEDDKPHNVQDMSKILETGKEKNYLHFLT